MDTKDLSTSSKDQNIATIDQSNDPSSSKAEKKVPMKTDTIENNKLEVKETQHCNFMPEQTSKSSFELQSNNNNNYVSYQVRLVHIF